MNKNFKSCACFGHRKIEGSVELENKLKIIFENLVLKENVKYFYFGGLGEFDDLCYKVVSELKGKYSQIYRIFCLFDPRHQRLSKRPKWLKDEGYEEIVYLDLSFDYWYNRIYFRNCAIIDKSDFMVFYVKSNYKNSGAYKTMEYAIKRKKQFINICF